MSRKKKDNYRQENTGNQGTRAERRRQYIFVIRELTSREIKRKYSRSYLGIVWSVLNPLLMMAVISLIFSQLFKRSIENYPIYYLTGNILWQLFTGATNAAMTALIDNKTMLIKVKLPMEIFVLARVYTDVYKRQLLDHTSVSVQGAIRLKPRNIGDFHRYPQSAYVQYASIVCLEKRRYSCG